MYTTDQTPKWKFDQEELVWPDPEGMTLEELLATDGIFKFSRIKKALGLTSAQLSKLSKTAKRKSINTYEVYGFGKPSGGQYLVRMSRFRVFYENWRQQEHKQLAVSDASSVLSIPDEIDANGLIQLQGYYHLEEIGKFSPFRELLPKIRTYIRNFATPEQAKETIGAWYEPALRESIVDMQPFMRWFFSELWMHKKKPA